MLYFFGIVFFIFVWLATDGNNGTFHSFLYCNGIGQRAIIPFNVDHRSVLIAVCHVKVID